MTVPAHARFSVVSPFPLKISYPHNVSFTLTLDAPVHLASTAPIQVIPVGILSQGFAQGWCRLPVELKLEILRNGVVRDSPIWPANANRAMHDSLLPYLRMTSDIAALARTLFFNENVFVLWALQEHLAMFRGWPPVSVRPLLKRIRLITWLDSGDNATIEAIANKRFGFDSLTYVEVRCSVLKFVRSSVLRERIDVDTKAEDLSTQLSLCLPPKIRFGPKGVIEFDRPQVGRGCVDMKLLRLVDLVEGLIKERFDFGVSPLD
jgi:hypothetical protein